MKLVILIMLFNSGCFLRHTSADEQPEEIAAVDDAPASPEQPGKGWRVLGAFLKGMGQGMQNSAKKQMNCRPSGLGPGQLTCN